MRRKLFTLAAAAAAAFALLGTIGIAVREEPTANADRAHPLPSFREIAELGHAGGRAVVFSADGNRILTAGKTAVQLWDATTYKPLGEPMEHGDDLRYVAC